ncbi:MAG TPA: cyclopropane fatty acyl phospholipid synthase [Steroidobacteraceae bacterium]|nr:cyclopropane fatty acyl phospholipid synthase [Steroidobacteraceae bacterium]
MNTVPRLAASSYRRALVDLLARAGVTVDGTEPWDLRVHDERMFRRVLAQGSLGAGESYMDGWWDCDRLDEMMRRVLEARIDAEMPSLRQVLAGLRARLLNPQTPRRSFTVAQQHYDIGDDLYERMLDRRMIYSCAYWRTAHDLDGAQEAKLDLVCRKLGLRAGMRVLDIGCGWGGAAQFAAERYGVNVTGITISRHQAEAARARCRGQPVNILLEDYRSLAGQFDRIYSLGMFEHVGVRNYRKFFETMRRLLTEDGLFLLHTIGANVSATANDPWVERYIFPNSLLPSMAQIAQATEDLWVTEDWHSFGADYDRTLLAWYGRFERRWPEIAATYGERFRRMWRFWLLSSAAAFRARSNQLWQIVLSPHGVSGGYTEVR